MNKRDGRRLLQAQKARRDSLRKKIACVGGAAATALVRELDRVTAELSRTMGIHRN